LNRPGRGGQRALNLPSHGLPNKSLQRSAHSGNVIRETRRLDALRPRPLNSSVRPLLMMYASHERMETLMKFSVHPILRFKPILVGLTLFSFMWVWVREANRAYQYYQDTSGFYCSHCSVPPDQEQIFLAILLVIASLTLLLKNKWSHLAGVILGGYSFYWLLFAGLWQSAANAEVPVFSSLNMRLRWQGLRDGHLLQIILAGFFLCYSVFSIIRLIRSSKNPTMSNNSFNRSAG